MWTLGETRVVRFFPKGPGPDGKMQFGLLRRPVIQVPIVCDDGLELVLKYSMRTDTWFLQWPDTQEHPILRLGNKRTVIDRLSPKVTVKGTKERYPTLREFHERLAFLGSVREEVMAAFYIALEEV